MTDIMKIVHALRMSNSRLHKENILKLHAGNAEWRAFLSAVYDTGINYGVSAPKDSTFRLQADPQQVLIDALKLTRSSLSGNTARRFAMEASQEHGEMFRIILDGSLKAGVNITTLNKIMPGLIKTYPLMLAKEVKDVRYPLLASIKYDGVRILVRVSQGVPSAMTRAGKSFPLESLVEGFAGAPDGVYDGELVWGEGHQEGRTRITGWVNKVLKGGLNDFDGYSYVVFDWVPLNSWDNQESSMGYVDRLAAAYAVAGGVIQIAAQTAVHNDDQVTDMFDAALSTGWEGLILRYPDDPYVWKRSDRLIKRKAIKDAMMVVSGVTEGKGKYAGMIGALECIGRVETKEVTVNVGSGLSDFDRARQPGDYIGKTVEVSYNDVVKAEGAAYSSLFLPRIKRVYNKLDI